MKGANKGFLTVTMLIGMTALALVYFDRKMPALATPLLAVGDGGQQVVTVQTRLVQDKVLKGSDGKVGMALTLNGAEIVQESAGQEQPVDLVVVLDRSGSMEGKKIEDAKQAVIRLMDRLSPQDRMAVLSYSNGVEMIAGLTPMENGNRQRLSSQVGRIQPGGGTNLGGGLEHGISTLKYSPGSGRQRKIILISDGLANQGVTDPGALGHMAADGVEYNLAVSTVGVGYDFNEVLMTTIADHGAGSYHFLQNPIAFAKTFEKEFEMTRNIVASALELRIPLSKGVQLVDAGGYPIRIEGNHAVIRPGDLLSGQKRTLFLTYQVPSHLEQNIPLGNIQVDFLHRDKKMQEVNATYQVVACVENEEEAVASIDKQMWSEQVVKEDYNKLKNTVATAIRKGRKEEALQSIQEYEHRNRSINKAVGSSAVAENLDGDVQDLRQSVEDTFTGAPAVVAEKKKQQAKVLQYESYQMRRDKK